MDATQALAVGVALTVTKSFLGTLVAVPGGKLVLPMESTNRLLVVRSNALLWCGVVCVAYARSTPPIVGVVLVSLQQQQTNTQCIS